MLILGTTSDDKGAQLEQLVRTLLEQQGLTKVRLNVIGAGGNELDVVAVRESAIVGDLQVTKLMCEAKAKADAVDMPMWQRFLGKLFIERASDPTTVGMLVALNGVNGNVAGSYSALKSNDPRLFIFEGKDLIKHAMSLKQIGEEVQVRATLAAQFHREASRIEVAYYQGAFMWVAYWNVDQYSIADGQGRMLLAEDVEKLRGALEATVSGTLLATDEARAEAEARHLAKLEVINQLFRGIEVVDGAEPRLSEAVSSLAEEPYVHLEDGRLTLVAPSELDSSGISRLFVSMFEDAVRVSLLSFMIDGWHVPYVTRLVELLPELQAGFSLEEEEVVSLQAIASLFPSVWLAIASPISAIAAHRGELAEQDPAVRAADRALFWQIVISAIRSDYGNARLHGFLYDHINVAEIEERVSVVVKSKSGPIGLPIQTETRDAVRQYTDESIGDRGPVYVMVRLLSGVDEPWDDSHPNPEFPLD